MSWILTTCIALVKHQFADHPASCAMVFSYMKTLFYQKQGFQSEAIIPEQRGRSPVSTWSVIIEIQNFLVDFLFRPTFVSFWE